MIEELLSTVILQYFEFYRIDNRICSGNNNYDQNINVNIPVIGFQITFLRIVLKSLIRR